MGGGLVTKRGVIERLHPEPEAAFAPAGYAARNVALAAEAGVGVHRLFRA